MTSGYFLCMNNNNKGNKMNKLIFVTLLNALVLPPLFGMESNNNNQQSDRQLAKLAHQAAKNLNLGHKLIYLGTVATDPEEQKERISFGFQKIEDANKCVDHIKDRVNSPKTKKE